MNEIRVRIFIDGEWSETRMVSHESEVLADPKVHNAIGDGHVVIIYVDDLYWRLVAHPLTMRCYGHQLSVSDPQVRGLYAKAVAAESAK